ncbi:MAG TPA: sigma-70 family RNA polymerase sigma factor [Blastocatellia bacterium]|nr:sigma-70 family RNA polymerase sigma factor [Blastocatellia bacterium]
MKKVSIEYLQRQDAVANLQRPIFKDAVLPMLVDQSISHPPFGLSSTEVELSRFPAPAADSDDHLIELTLNGNEAAFELLLRRHHRRVFSIARRFFRSRETVEDIVQETFAKAFFSLASYRRGATFEQWLAKIAVNNCYDELRRRKKRSESLITELSTDEEGWLQSKLAQSAFEIHLNESEKGIAMEISGKLLASLSVEDRLVLTLLHAENNSIKEIAQITGWSEAKVKIRAFRARHSMRKAFLRLRKTEERKSRLTGESTK